MTHAYTPRRDDPLLATLTDADLSQHVQGAYVYRFDFLTEVVRQVTDGASRLRPRPITEAPTFFPHEQTTQALLSRPADHTVAQLSFWRSVDAALARLPCSEAGRPHCLQRVPVRTPGLQLLRAGADEYLSQALLLWNTIANEDYDGPSLGVGHTQIDVADPSGRWIPLVTAPWYGPPFIGGISVCADDPRTRVHVELHRPLGQRREQWVVARQACGRGAGLLFRTHLHRQLQAAARDYLQLYPHTPLRWFLTYESVERVEIAEISCDSRSLIQRLRDAFTQSRATLEEPRLLSGPDKQYIQSVARIPALEQSWRYSTETISLLRQA